MTENRLQTYIACYNILMDNFEYLNQISQANRPVKHSLKSSNNPKTGLIVKLSVAGVVLFFLLMAIGSMLSNLSHKSNDLVKQIYTRSTNLNSVLTTYNRDLKSSQLCAIGTSLSTILTNASNQLATYLTKDGKDKDALTLDEKTAASESALIEDLNFSLTNAKLNGILDRYYDNQIGLQVSLLLSQTSELLARTKDSNLVTIISNFHSSLETIHQSIEAYSSN